MDHQVHILGKIYKGAHLITLLCGLSQVLISLPNYIRCRSKLAWVRLIHIWLVFNQYWWSFARRISSKISKIIEACVLDRHWLCLSNINIFWELFGIIKLEETTINFNATSWIHDLNCIFGGTISEEQSALKYNVLWREATHQINNRCLVCLVVYELNFRNIYLSISKNVNCSSNQ